MERKYSVYTITCLINKKIYIGYTKHSIQHRFKQHINKSKYNVINKFLNAIRYYGSENFRVELLISVNNKEDALKNEVRFINEYNSIKNGYNTSKGGTDGSTGQKKGYILSEGHKKNISLNHHDIKGERNPFYGKKHTEESKKKLSEALKGRVFTEEWREKLSEANKGKHIGKKWWNDGCGNTKFSFDCPGDEWKLGRK